MSMSQEDHDRLELRSLERRLADVTNPGRQVTPTTSGQEYRKRLREDIRRLRERLPENQASGRSS